MWTDSDISKVIKPLTVISLILASAYVSLLTRLTERFWSNSYANKISAIASTKVEVVKLKLKVVDLKTYLEVPVISKTSVVFP